MKADGAHRLLHGLGGLLEGGLLLRGELHLDDLLQATPPQLARHAAVHPGQPVLPLEPRRAREDALLVEHDCGDHLRDRGRRGIIGGAGLEMADDLAPAVARALDDLVEPRFVEELRDGDSGHRGLGGGRPPPRGATAAHRQQAPATAAGPKWSRQTLRRITPSTGANCHWAGPFPRGAPSISSTSSPVRGRCGTGSRWAAVDPTLPAPT